MTAPTTFDPAAYVADMRAAGVEVLAYQGKDRSRSFDIKGNPGIPEEMWKVQAKWDAARIAHPDWMAAVHDFLVAEEGAPCSPA